MKKKIIFLVLIIALVGIITDAVIFSRTRARMVREQPAGIEAARAFLDDSPIGDACIAPPSCGGSPNATCYQLYWRAVGLGCTGDDYASAECKDIKELHEFSFCSSAKKECGRELPKIIAPAPCHHWWDYWCRISHFIDTIGQPAPRTPELDPGL